MDAWQDTLLHSLFAEENGQNYCPGVVFLLSQWNNVKVACWDQLCFVGLVSKLFLTSARAGRISEKQYG